MFSLHLEKSKIVQYGLALAQESRIRLMFTRRIWCSLLNDVSMVAETENEKEGVSLSSCDIVDFSEG